MLEEIKQFIKKNKYIDTLYVRYKWRERKASFGDENPDKVFYVIRRAPSKVGLFSYVTVVMGQIKYAVDHGYIPIVDMQNSENTYLESGELGKVNAWEYFFEQPCGYTLKDILNSKHIILSTGLLPEEYPEMQMIQSRENYDMWRGYSKQYLKMIPEAVSKIDKKYRQMFEENKTLGVLCRGTDYTNKRPAQHPIQPAVEDIIQKSEEMLQDHGCQYVFLATEDEDIYQEFYRAFGDKLRVSDAKRYENIGSSNINDVSFDRERDKYRRGFDYLITIGILAKCDYLVAGCAGGTYGALLLTKGYIDQYIYWLGCYPA